ncbi:methyltransferase [Meiothermus ruber]|jgi:16S rRNA (guanine1207-N2)-methyltransferase|uniref:Methyltransferase small n=1 Tax=Meiothermus ruber (strain ATCC 35948 / DSM 1279 / VKM B-1258 / 21) TaxID=504728 RepID=D3PRM2_MEIRD|nr:methyltransferase [Meiothermus ruber]ADD28105.1 methyltransferase small [Meiothermus ruber DSM 1279]AGK04575.1 methyltransferase small [Meiothermus ruber DSM 1279]MCL6528816.1 methyltransferase [Meiothermus ruber]GAO75054.1 methyltransferase small [Meiothermus ruber H328]
MNLEAYHTLLKTPVPGGFLYTKPGARGSQDPAYTLLAEVLEPHGQSALDLNPGIGLVTHALRQQGLRVQAIETSRASLRCLEASFGSSVRVTRGLPWATEPDSADLVALVLPAHRGTRFVELALLGAARALRTGGRLWIAGSKDKGFAHYFKLAQAWVGYGLLVRREGAWRVAVLEKEKPAPSLPEVWQSFDWAFMGKTLSFSYLPGVFSGGHLDPGSAMLLRELPQDLGHVLDIGGGYGALSRPLLGRAQGLTLLEDDWISVLCAQKNLGEAATVLHSDVDEALTEDQTFTTIITNPPFHVGGLVVLETAIAFIEAAHARLERGGKFYLVANRFLPYEPLLEARFATVRTLAVNTHKVLVAYK